MRLCKFLRVSVVVLSCLLIVRVVQLTYAVGSLIAPEMIHLIGMRLGQELRFCSCFAVLVYIMFCLVSVFRRFSAGCTHLHADDCCRQSGLRLVIVCRRNM